jgi:DNA repair protein RadC
VLDYIEKNCQPKSEQWREMAWVLTLNKGREVTGHFLLSAGGTSSTVIDKKVVAKVAIEQLADAVILVHNHPSGNCLPSRSDIKETGDIKKALDLFGISLLDHIIIADKEYYSFASEEKTER